MSRQDANAAFARTSFLYGGNAAYIEELYVALSRPIRHRSMPNGGRSSTSLKDERADVIKSASGAVLAAAELAARRRRAGRGARPATGPRSRRPSATRSRRKAQASGVELTAADVQQATRDSIRALMLIRAYRVRGHFHANLDPLGLEPHKNDEELDPRSYGFTEADLDRKIFLDNVLGLEFGDACARSSRSCAHLLPDARRRVHAHLRSGAEGLDPGAHRRPRQGDHLHPRGQARDPQQAGRGRRLREVLRRQVHRHQALRPRRRRVADPGARADHQARRRARRQGDRARHGRIAAGSTCWRR